MLINVRHNFSYHCFHHNSSADSNLHYTNEDEYDNDDRLYADFFLIICVCTLTKMDQSYYYHDSEDIIYIHILFFDSTIQ